jgi:hypothetical protein
MPKVDIGMISSISSNDSGQITFDFSSPTVAPTAFTFNMADNKLHQLAKVSTFGFDFSNYLHAPQRARLVRLRPRL